MTCPQELGFTSTQTVVGRKQWLCPKAEVWEMGREGAGWRKRGRERHKRTLKTCLLEKHLQGNQVCELEKSNTNKEWEIIPTTWLKA